MPDYVVNSKDKFIAPFEVTLADAGNRRAAMSKFLLSYGLCVLLCGTAQQDATQPTPSVADAARTARERQKAGAVKRVITEDELPSRKQLGAQAGNEAQTRAALEKTYPTLNAVDMTNELNQAEALSKMSASKIVAEQEWTALAGHQKLAFPGKKEWENQLEEAVTRLIDEAGAAYPKLQEILDTNRPAILKHDAEVMKKVRTQWFDALVPYMSWHAKVRQILADGQARATSFATNPTCCSTPRAVN